MYRGTNADSASGPSGPLSDDDMLSCKLDDHLEREGSRMFQNLFF
jgi:hypothetical protein